MPGTAEAGDLFGAAVTQLRAPSWRSAPPSRMSGRLATPAVHLISWTKRYGAAEGERAPDPSGQHRSPVGERVGRHLWGGSRDTDRDLDLVRDDHAPAPPDRLTGEDLGSISDAGFVTFVTDPTLSGTLTSLALRQGDGLPGTAEAGDRVGAALGAPGHPRTSASAITSGAWVSAPGEDIAGVADASVVAVTTTWPRKLTRRDLAAAGHGRSVRCRAREHHARELGGPPADCVIRSQTRPSRLHIPLGDRCTQVGPTSM